MYEIEMKFKFTNKKTDEIIDKLKKLNLDWSVPVIQKDKIFLSKDMIEYKIIRGTQILRIREENKKNCQLKTIFTMKVQLENNLESKEFETQVEDASQMISIINELGFKQFVEVKKHELLQNTTNTIFV